MSPPCPETQRIPRGYEVPWISYHTSKYNTKATTLYLPQLRSDPTSDLFLALVHCHCIATGQFSADLDPGFEVPKLHLVDNVVASHSLREISDSGKRNWFIIREFTSLNQCQSTQLLTSNWLKSKYAFRALKVILKKNVLYIAPRKQVKKKPRLHSFKYDTIRTYIKKQPNSSNLKHSNSNSEKNHEIVSNKQTKKIPSLRLRAHSTTRSTARQVSKAR